MAIILFLAFYILLSCQICIAFIYFFAYSSVFNCWSGLLFCFEKKLPLVAFNYQRKTKRTLPHFMKFWQFLPQSIYLGSSYRLYVFSVCISGLSNIFSQYLRVCYLKCIVKVVNSFQVNVLLFYPPSPSPSPPYFDITVIVTFYANSCEYSVVMNCF